uniref:Uncharacterized protein n=1 Tax=Arundo donax TaxID=35708 RepID=A0A0A9BKV9_ARUDO
MRRQHTVRQLAHTHGARPNFALRSSK